MKTRKAPPENLPAMDRLLAVMAILRDPNGGCAWDLQQDFASIAPCTIEEAYEVSDAITRGDFIDLRDELGDLLLQVVFHGRMAEEAGHFDFAAIAESITDKMIRRHPHIFATEAARDAAGQLHAWEDQKALERQEKKQARENSGGAAEDPGVLADVALALPALMRAEKLQKRAARVGFDWPDATPVFAKLDEEISELQSALAAPRPSQDHIREEVGDLLFTVVNLARKIKVDPELALREASDKFTRRFKFIEQQVRKQGTTMQNSDLHQLEQYWLAAKAKFAKDSR